MDALVLAIETSCDETAAAVVRHPGRVLSSEIASQIALHRAHGGIVPELASRNHLPKIRPVVTAALDAAGAKLGDIDVFAATSGPGLASSLLIGHASAKSFAVAFGRPFVGVNHLEGHLLSPYLSVGSGVERGIGLIVSGGHTQLVLVDAPGRYRTLGRTRDDAAGEAFDKVGKMLGLPYPGGPEIEQLARTGNPEGWRFPRSMVRSGDDDFSFSGLKTAVLYALRDLGDGREERLPDLAASFQAAVVEVLVEKTVSAARRLRVDTVGVSGGVSCNRCLREAFRRRATTEGLRLLLTDPELTTDNAAMIGHVAGYRHAAGLETPLSEDVDPNLAL